MRIPGDGDSRTGTGPRPGWFVLLLIGSVCGCAAEPRQDARCAADLLPGDLVITEIMANPLGPDEGQEWFEIFNASDRALDLSGLEVVAAAADGTSQVSHILQGLAIQPGQYLVLADVREDPAPDYVDYVYGSGLGSLRNAGGRLSLECDGQVIDRVNYVATEEATSRGFDGSRAPDALANDDIQSWCDARTTFTQGSLGTPGTVNDACGQVLPPDHCVENDLTRDTVPLLPGDLVITEFMPNPDAAPDSTGEWFEVLVTRNVDLNGLELGKIPGDIEQRLAANDCLAVQAGTYLVLAVSDVSSDNGGLPGVDVLLTFSLSNSNSGIFVGYEGNLLDSVNYTSTFTGAATSLDPTMTDGDANDSPDAWCRATSTYGAGDHGTPGQANPSCGIVPEGQCFDQEQLREKVSPVKGDLVISEFMANPDAVGDTPGEWFEVYVARDVDLNGLQMGRDPVAPDQELPQGNCLAVSAGSYLVFAKDTSAADNGGLPVVDFDIDFGLVNSNGNIFIGLDGQVLDQVGYTSVGTGAATSLDPDFLDPDQNDDSANWCLAVDSYGLGDLGTPGAANPECL